MKDIIENKIRHVIVESRLNYYREPLFGYANAHDPLFQYYQTLITPSHLTPMDILPEARSVLSFFLPFKKEITQNNRSGELASSEWAEVYIKTNRLISQICVELQKTLLHHGVRFAFQPPTYVFDTERLIAAWSHKHIAYACGLGTFGRNHLLITEKGCGGRLGSGVLDIDLEPSRRTEKVHSCLYDSNHCQYCAKICPVNALSDSEFKRRPCYEQCQLNNQHYAALDSCEVCGKCVTGPCSFIE